jgi:nicotinamide riboside kinase
VKIAVIGTHGVGKTTLVHIIAAHLLKQGKSTCVVDEVVRDCPFPINERSTVDGGYWIVTEQISRELTAEAKKYEFIVCDRSAIDPVMYLNAHDFKQHYCDLKDFAMKWMQTYDLIIYVKPMDNSKIMGDGFRDTNKRFQEKVDDEFNLCIDSLFLSYLKMNIYKIDQGEIFTPEINNRLNRIFTENDLTNGEEEWISG